jgi:hypothetical protein
MWVKTACLRRQSVFIEQAVVHAVSVRFVSCDGAVNRLQGIEWMQSNEGFLKKHQNAVAGSLTCTNLPIRQRKPAAEKRKRETRKAAPISSNQKRSFIKHRSNGARVKPSEVARKRKTKLCAVHENAQASVV